MKKEARGKPPAGAFISQGFGGKLSAKPADEGKGRKFLSCRHVSS